MAVYDGVKYAHNEARAHNVRHERQPKAVRSMEGLGTATSLAGASPLDGRLRQLLSHRLAPAQVRGPSKTNAIAPGILDLAHELTTLYRHGTSVELRSRRLEALKGLFKLRELPVHDGPAWAGGNLLVC